MFKFFFFGGEGGEGEWRVPVSVKKNGTHPHPSQQNYWKILRKNFGKKCWQKILWKKKIEKKKLGPPPEVAPELTPEKRILDPHPPSPIYL